MIKVVLTKKSAFHLPQLTSSACFLVLRISLPSLLTHQHSPLDLSHCLWVKYPSRSHDGRWVFLCIGTGTPFTRIEGLRAFCRDRKQGYSIVQEKRRVIFMFCSSRLRLHVVVKSISASKRLNTVFRQFASGY